MRPVQKILARPVNGREYMKFVLTDGTAAFVKRGRASLQSFSASILPKAPIRYAFYVFLFCIPFEERLGGLSLLGLALAGLTLIQPRLFFQAPPKAFWYCVTYLFVVAGLGLLAVPGGEQDVEYTSEVITQLFRLFQLLFFFLIAYRLMTFEAVAKKSVLIFSFSCVVMAVLQLSGVIATATHGRMTADEVNPNVVAMLLSVGLVTLLGLAHAFKDTSVTLRLFAWLGSALLLIPIVGTGSRGSQLALALALIVLIVKPANIPQKVKIAFIVTAVIVSVVWIAYRTDVVRERWERTYYEGEVAGRDLLFTVAWEMFLERPIFGWGPVKHYWEMNIRTADRDGGDPHNTYLWVLKETGLLGFVPFFIVLWVCWRSAWKARGSRHGSLPVALLLLILANNMKGVYLFFKLFWFVLAYALASGTYVTVQSEGSLQPVRSRKLTAVGSVSEEPTSENATLS